MGVVRSERSVGVREEVGGRKDTYQPTGAPEECDDASKLQGAGVDCVIGFCEILEYLLWEGSSGKA